MITLCTLFDSAYMAKGLSLIASLRRHAPGFALYILTLDDKVRDYFEEHTINGVVPIHLQEIESPELLKAKASRTYTEYVWTLSSYFTDWCAGKFTPPSIAYIDSDCYFFGNPASLYEEVEPFAIAITPHRYTPSQAERLKGAGVYNVGWVYFDRLGYACLHDWRNKCLEWCYHRIEPDGRMADQGYLNDWPQRWGAHSVYNLGVNLGPWNQEQYDYYIPDESFFTDRLIVSDGRRNDQLLMYHFHGFEGIGKRTGYPLHPMVAEHVYKPYEAEYARWMG